MKKGTDQEYYEYYCMGGNPPVWNQQVAVIDVDLQNPSQGVYYLTSPVSNDTMLWDVVKPKNKKYLKLFNNATATYINRKNLIGNADSDVVFCTATGTETPMADIYYNSGTHNLYFQANWRILFDDTNKKFYFNKSDQGTIPTQDGGIWLFKCSTNTEVRLHEFK